MFCDLYSLCLVKKIFDLEGFPGRMFEHVILN